MNQLTLSKAIEGWHIYAQARKLSPHTVTDYTNAFNKFSAHLGADLPIEQITPQQVIDFMAAQTVSAKSIYNYHIALSALWTWAMKYGLATTHILRQVDRPKPEAPEIIPYSQKDIKAMLGSLDRSAPYKNKTHRLHHVHRHRAIIYLLLDTGMRAEELCSLRHCDLDLNNNKVTVWGKGKKQRSLPISPRTSQTIWKYLLLQRDQTINPNAPLFATRRGAPIARRKLLESLQSIGARAGVSGVTCHRFRHTFAINYLRNHGDVYTLQMLLGHSTFTMVRRYLALAQADLDRAHIIASPVTNWGL